MPFVWSSDMATGIDVIDSQHMRIVDYINELETAVAAKNPSIVGQLLDELVDYTLSHFAFEESMQEEANYKFAKPHKAIHDTFAKRVAKYQERHNAGEDIAKELYDLLCTWLVHHIKRDDMAYVPVVKASMGTLTQDMKEGSWLTRTLGRFFR